MKRVVILLLLSAIAVGLPFYTVGLSGHATYDLQSILVAAQRCAYFILWSISILYIFTALTDDDLEKDYDRINQGNVAVAIYRGAQLYGIYYAGSVLLAKV